MIQLTGADSELFSTQAFAHTTNPENQAVRYQIAAILSLGYTSTMLHQRLPTAHKEIFLNNADNRNEV